MRPEFIHKGAGYFAATTALVLGAWAPKASSPKHATQKIAKSATSASLSFASTVRPLLGKYCIQCHGGDSPAAGLSFESLKTEASLKAKRDLWDRIALNLGSGHMPPEGMPKPLKKDRSAVVAWIQTRLTQDCSLSTPGRVTMRRLNRMEYDNTIRDLLGQDLHLSADFPSDDVGYGFDNIGDVLSISPLLMEKYLRAAEVASKAAIRIKEPNVFKYEGENLINSKGGGIQPDNSWIVYSFGSMYAEHQFPRSGLYRVTIKGYGQQAGPEPVKMAIKIDNQLAAKIDVTATASKPGEYSVEQKFEAGKHRLEAEFLNDYYQKGPPPQDRNLVVTGIEVANPKPVGDDTSDVERQIIYRNHGPTDVPAAKEFLTAFAQRAFRRPVTPAEADRLGQLADLVMRDGQPFERAIQVGVQAVLSSPNFIFRVEREDGKAKVGAYELASRLSYFLWSSCPDARLMKLAGTGELLKPAVLNAEAKRMLADPKSNSLADGFAAQWLNLRKLSTIFPDPKMFPSFSDALREDMLTETHMFFDQVVREDRSVIDFLSARYSYVNGRLAAHYGIPGVTGDAFRKVSLEGTPRAGVLTQASVLTLTSNPTRTSPVKRGKWVLDELLNQPPPPPPPGVGTLKDDGHILTGATLRARMEQHRKDPNCATCHMRMDPIGFSLENFDATGKWRTEDSGVRINSTGVLPDGTKFAGPAELKRILVGRKDQFARCLSEKLLTYALGRGIEPSDKCNVDQVTEFVKSHDYRFSAMVSAIVVNDSFRLRTKTHLGTQ